MDDGVDPATVVDHLTGAGLEVLGVRGQSVVAIAGGPVGSEVADHPAISWVGPLSRRETHNEAAGTLIGSTAAIAAGYNGSTQIVAVADTGLGDGTTTGAHPDIPASRIVAIEDWDDDGLFGCRTSIDDGPQDVDSGHGTHTTGSVLSDGAADGTGRGSAPGASLVFQAVEDYSDYTLVCELLGNEDGYELWALPDDLGELFQQAYDLGARIHSDSWGADVFGEYDSSSADADDFMWNNPGFLIVTSAGNAGTDSDADGDIDPDSIGSPATAKNVLTVGASEGVRGDGLPCDGSLSYDNSAGVSCTDQGGLNLLFAYGDAWPSDYPAGPIATDPSAGNAEQMAAFSSRGPTDDGRIKPDVVAPGTWILSTYSPLYQEGYGDPVNPINGLYQSDGWGFPANQEYKYLGGTSMSAPLVAGSAAVVRDYYSKEHDIDASAALTKATLINSAVDLTDEDNNGVDDNLFPIPNIHEGWGRIDVAAAVDGSLVFVDDASVDAGTSDEYEVEVAGGSPLKITVVWSDYPASEGAAPTLVNDLDVVVTAPDGSSGYLGNNFAGGWTVTGGTADSLNTVENVYLQTAGAGTWTVQVTGTNVPQGPQPYAMVIAGGTLGTGADTEAPVWPGAAEITEASSTATSLGLSWTTAGDNVGVVAYDVSVDGVVFISVLTNAATLAGLEAGTTYAVSIAARDAAGNSASGPTGSFTTSDVTPPTWDGGAVTLAGIGETSATVRWSTAIDDGGIATYQITIDSGGSPTSFVASGATNSLDIESLSPATTYMVTVNALDPAGNPSFDLKATFTTAIDFSDTNGHLFEGDIAWLSGRGITQGCGAGPDLFCPADGLTRDQMASLLVRAFDLPAVNGNRFTDVSGVHTANVNALAEAGITVGCNPAGTEFCPEELVTRAQMATFLVRSFDLSPTTTDGFDDDGGSIHEPAINALAVSGITLGCDTRSYCPNEVVNRGQIAAFLHRGFLILDLE